MGRPSFKEEGSGLHLALSGSAPGGEDRTGEKRIVDDREGEEKTIE